MKLRRSSHDPVLRPSAVFLWGASGVLLAVGLTAGLLVVYRNADPQRVSTLLDIVRIGLSVGAGTGGLFALWLATRRQRSAEQTLVLQREVSRSTVTDSTERRITDQYSKAIDQLGHEKAAVRLGAIYSLERIAQDHPGHRQTVVDVFCSYLRLPYSASDDLGRWGDWDGERPVEVVDMHAEMEVRNTVEHMIWDHLSEPGKRDLPGKFWPGMSLDLSRTVLVDPLLRFLRVKDLKCEDMVVRGDADFRGLRAEGIAGFGGAVFRGKVNFSGSVFSGGFALLNSTFEAEVDLSSVEVTGSFAVLDCSFREKADLSGCRSRGLVLDKCRFGGDVSFKGGDLQLLAVFNSEFQAGFYTHELELGPGSMAVGSVFRSQFDWDERIIRAESLEDENGFARAVADHFGVAL